jgi:serine/threonine protein phosphatase PrpC
MTTEPKRPINRFLTVATAQGDRMYQEDRHFWTELPSGLLIAVMDGHAGSKVAEFCQEQIGPLADSAFAEHQEAKEAISQIVSCLAASTEEYFDGSTISIAYIPNGSRLVVIAILGDSPVIVCDKAGKIHVSPEHNAGSNVEERNAAMLRGGRYTSGYIRNGSGQGIQLSRSLGDRDWGKILSREPEIYEIAWPEWVLVCSDGLIDPGHHNSAGIAMEIAESVNQGACAQELIDRAGIRDDNATVILWRRYPEGNRA